MSTAVIGSSHRLDVLHPSVAVGIGAVTFAATMVAGDLFDLNANEGDNPGLTDLAGYTGLVLVAAAAALWLGSRARAGSPSRLSGTALGLSLASVATLVAFWSGWPHVFAAAGIALALEYRRRVGSLSGPTTIALALGAVAFAATSVICLFG